MPAKTPAPAPSTDGGVTYRMPGDEGEAMPPAPGPAPLAPLAPIAAAVMTPADDGAADGVGEPEPDHAATRIAQLELENAQLHALTQSLQEQLLDAQEAAQAVAAAAPREPRLIGDNWSNRTTAEAMAAGVTKPVLCSDGYYVPGA